MIPVILCLMFHAPNGLSVNCRVVDAPSAHAAGLAVAQRQKDDPTWTVVWHEMPSRNMVIVHFESDSDD